MSNVDWRGVPASETEPEPEPGSPLPGLIGFVVIIAALVVVGGSYVSLTLLSGRVKQRAIDECGGPACVLEVRESHDDCFSKRIRWSVPGSVSAFQTPPESDMFGPVSVHYEGYVACVFPDGRSETP